jgi:ferric-dicitrate binding protein FerR (iron transport regulator)
MASGICYDSKLSSEGSRDVGMHHGAAYFEVQHNPQNPFTITTPQGVVIKVRGTGLAVNVNEFLKTVDVAVTHGLVDVSYRDHTSEITSGQRISIDLATKDKNITAFDASRMNHLSFDDIPLDTFARILEQRFHTPVRFAKEKLKKLRVNGDFVNDEIRLRHILRSMEGALTSYNLELRLEGSSVVIREKPKQYIPG